MRIYEIPFCLIIYRKDTILLYLLLIKESFENLCKSVMYLRAISMTIAWSVLLLSEQ